MRMAYQSILLLVVAMTLVSPVRAQCGVTYRVVYRTVYEKQPVTAYRLQTETILEEREVTTRRGGRLRMEHSKEKMDGHWIYINSGRG